jgi:hypothetical protein
MNLYLAEITFDRSLYEGPRQEGLKVIRLVKADNEDQARDKAYDYIRDKTSEYSIYYLATNVVISQCIE